MKKRIFIYLLFISFGIIMAVEALNVSEFINDEKHYRVIESERYNDKDFENWWKVYEYKIDEEMALKLANEAIKSYWGESVLKHTTYDVCKVGGKGYFVVTRKPKMWGSTYRICINEADGAILRAEKL